MSAVALVGSVSASLGLLMTAEGPLRPSRETTAAAAVAEAQVKNLSECIEAAGGLESEIRVFRDLVQSSGLFVAEPEGPNKGTRPRSTAADKAWPLAKPTYDKATRLFACKEDATTVAIPNDAAKQGWSTLDAVKGVKAPDGSLESQLAAAKQVYDAVEKAQVRPVVDHLEFSQKTAMQSAAELRKAVETSVVRDSLPQGLLGREAAMFSGVLLSVVALLLSFFSLRARSVRRQTALAPYRKASKAPERGIQAVTMIRLAAEPNGGEPGIVLGAAALGLLAAIVGRQDADWYVVGVMGGVLIGLTAQLLVRRSVGLSRFHTNCMALTELEKPAVPMVLVLGEVKPGHEEEFLGFFLKLSPAEAAVAVEKIAAQAEDQILAAADAAAR